MYSHKLKCSYKAYYENKSCCFPPQSFFLVTRKVQIPSELSSRWQHLVKICTLKESIEEFRARLT